MDVNKDPAPELEQQAATLIVKLGYRIARGPYLNRNRAKHRVYIFSIKTVLSKAELDKLEIKPAKDAKAGTQRTLRFLAEVIDGVVVAVKRIRSSERKKMTLRDAPPAVRRKIRDDNRRKKAAKKGTT